LTVKKTASLASRSKQRQQGANETRFTKKAAVRNLLYRTKVESQTAAEAQTALTARQAKSTADDKT